jgi:uncharacterized protein YdeI (YjbR/CyaY-like superfamily)
MVCNPPKSNDRKAKNSMDMSQDTLDEKVFNPGNRDEWRQWLERNHTSTLPVCVVIFNKSSKTQNLSYEDAVEEALCFGWIDNKGMKRDHESMLLRFAPRKMQSNWSALNRNRAEKMIKQGKMTEAGMVFIDAAKKSGKWAAAKSNAMPPDLKSAFMKQQNALKNFKNFAPSIQRQIINWVTDAKRPETRKRRIAETVEKAVKNIKVKP